MRGTVLLGDSLSAAMGSINDTRGPMGRVYSVYQLFKPSLNTGYSNLIKCQHDDGLHLLLYFGKSILKYKFIFHLMP